MNNPMIRHALLVPAAIILAGLFIAIAVYIIRSNPHESGRLGSPSAVRAVSGEDHIIGNPAAPVTIVEYSDTDCAYCKQFQKTMEQLMTEQANTGNVAWVYRHFPLVDVHPNAAKNAVAAECAATLGGTNAFWRFIDAMQAAAPDNIQFNPSKYGTLLPQFGIDAKAFSECIASEVPMKKVDADFQNALASGTDGAPYTVILIKDHPPIPISGAISYSALKKIVDDAVMKATAK